MTRNVVGYIFEGKNHEKTTFFVDVLEYCGMRATVPLALADESTVGCVRLESLRPSPAYRTKRTILPALGD